MVPVPVIPHIPDEDEPPEAADLFDVVCPVMAASIVDEDHLEPGFVPCWTSTKWSTHAAAQARLDEHMIEHKTGKPAPELVESAAKTGAKIAGDALKMARAAHREAEKSGAVVVEPQEDDQ